MKIILNSRRHHYVARVSIFLVMVALIAGMAGCGGGGDGGDGGDGGESYTLNIASTAGGSVTTPGEGTSTYDEETVIDVVAEAEEGYQFVNWTGDVGTIGNVNAASTTITMNSDYSITAEFETIPPIQYNLTLSSTAGGSVTTPGEGTFTYDEGTVVNLVATPASGYLFVNWTGDVDTIANANAASTTITMNANYTITANFVVIPPIPPIRYSVTISSTVGGSVTTPGEGTFTRYAGTVVSLVANPLSGYRFVNWTGDVGTIANVNAASTTITMNGDYSITANFVAVYDLTISSTAGGSVTTPGEGTSTYDEGTVVNLVAEADACYEFINWTGDVDTIADVYAASTNITTDAAKNVTANFALLSYNLTADSTDGGSVTDPGEGTFTYDCGMVVDLVATPADGYRFVNWTGDVGTITNVNATSTTISMNGDYSITANFIAQYDLTISSNTGGSVTIPGEGTFPYDDGTVVDLVADAEEGYCFVNWTGDVGTVANINATSTTITMNSDYSITANFEEDEVVTFPDPNLEAAIREAIGKPTGLIYASDIEGLTSLLAGVRNITDLTGLEYCTNLAHLEARENQISDISPLASLTNLTTIFLYENQIGDISPLANLTNLTSLTLSSNQIGDISPLANLTNLITLRISSNQISDISALTNLTNLTDLEFGGNQISDISALTNLTSLTKLFANTNQISDISPLASLTNLATLYLYDNQISDISPLANLTNLTDLWSYSNPISDTSPLANLTNLIHLRLGGNQISDISPLANLTNLTDLRLCVNQISDISPLANLTHLYYLELSNNQISDISPLANLRKLTHLHLRSNQISDIEPLVNNPGLSQGDKVYLWNNPLSDTSINIYIPQLEARGVTVDY